MGILAAKFIICRCADDRSSTFAREASKPSWLPGAFRFAPRSEAALVTEGFSGLAGVAAVQDEPMMGNG